MLSGGLRTAVIAGGVLVFLSPLLPWVDVIIFSENLFNAGGIATLIGLLQMAAAAWVIVEAWRRRPRRRLGLIVGVVVAVVDGLLLIGLLHDVHHTYGLAQVGVGPWVGVAGAITVWVASFRMPKDKRSMQSTPLQAAASGAQRLPWPPHPDPSAQAAHEAEHGAVVEPPRD